MSWRYLRQVSATFVSRVTSGWQRRRPKHSKRTKKFLKAIRQYFVWVIFQKALLVQKMIFIIIPFSSSYHCRIANVSTKDLNNQPSYVFRNDTLCALCGSISYIDLFLPSLTHLFLLPSHTHWVRSRLQHGSYPCNLKLFLFIVLCSIS